MNAMNTPWGGGRGGRGSRRGRPPFAEMAAAMGQAAMAAGEAMGEGPDDEDPRVRRLRDARRGGPHGRGGRRGGPGGFGPGFGPGGFGPGFPPGPPRGFGRRGGRRTNRGDVRSAVLALVAEAPRHGYEIIQEITERTGGRWKPSPGSVYPTLSQLEDEGLVRVEKTEGRRVVHLTESGTTYVAEHREELDAVWAAFDSDDGEDDPAAGLWQELGQLHAAGQQVMATGTPEQIATATASITEARKSIYRLLAE
ncbi:PadR family transcriptional regulator [Pseudonocardia sp. KRD291]|uniref:PadR family transcriptional regulator n=1 Tax=Pseudonocardia sp. KRD291 TaxID=2792007 RepID=UPI001C5C5F59|nr:PadR family transcriptional regulator [Pseudonocardia sp. KRD291]MBW0102349.1 PadR family transcriptional regulator [Pseudonocardia sp. KRD291]